MFSGIEHDSAGNYSPEAIIIIAIDRTPLNKPVISYDEETIRAMGLSLGTYLVGPLATVCTTSLCWKVVWTYTLG